MTVREFAEVMGMKVLAGEGGMDREVSGIYVCDLLSWVMSHADKGDAWITVHTHINVVAVALLTEASCIVIPEGIEAEEASLKKAAEEGIPVLSSSSTAYEVCWKGHGVLTQHGLNTQA